MTGNMSYISLLGSKQKFIIIKFVGFIIIKHLNSYTGNSLSNFISNSFIL